MNETVAYKLSPEDHARAMHLLEEIKRQSGGLVNKDEAFGHVITALAESALWLMIAATPVPSESIP